MGHLTLPPSPAYYLPRHLAPSPAYPHLYPPYLIRGYPDTAALENRQTIINDYITSQQMHHNAASAMAQRADMLRGLSPRESSLALNYAAGPRGELPRTVPIPRASSCTFLCCGQKILVSLCIRHYARWAERATWLPLGASRWLRGVGGTCWLLGEEGRCLAPQFPSSNCVRSRRTLLSPTWAFPCCSESLV